MPTELHFDPGTYEATTFRNLGGRVVSKRETSAVVSEVLSKPGAKLLDLGVGTGRISRVLLKNPQISIVGVDANERMLRTFKNHSSPVLEEMDRLDLVVADAQHLPFRSEVFETVVCVRVAKYLAEPEDALTEMNAVLKKRGKLILETPSLLGLQGLLSHLFLHPFQHNQLPRFFGRRRTIGWLVARGMRIESISAWHKIPNGLMILVDNPVLIRALIHLDDVLLRITPTEFLSRSIVFSVWKAEACPRLSTGGSGSS